MTRKEPDPDVAADRLLLAGVAVLALTTGLMVGNSSTPVVGAAVPAVFGILTAAIGLGGAGRVERSLRTLGVDAGGEAAERAGASVQRVERSARRRTGLALVLFSALFLVGAGGGAWLRISGALRGWAHRDFPWKDAAPPSDPNEVVAWVAFQERLLDLGYDRDDIAACYRAAAVGAPAPDLGTGGSAAPDVTVAVLDGRRDPFVPDGGESADGPEDGGDRPPAAGPDDDGDATGPGPDRGDGLDPEVVDDLLGGFDGPGGPTVFRRENPDDYRRLLVELRGMEHARFREMLRDPRVRTGLRHLVDADAGAAGAVASRGDAVRLHVFAPEVAEVFAARPELGPDVTGVRRGARLRGGRRAPDARRVREALGDGRR